MESASLEIETHKRFLEFPYKPALIHQVVNAYLANARSGTVAQKTRAEVRGGGKKPWKQKGTGRARAGTTRGPLWRGGGRTFAIKNRDYSQKVNKKMYRQSMLSLLSELNRREKLKVVDSFSLDQISTKAMKEKIAGLGLQQGRVLIVDNDINQNAWLSVRNLPNVYLIAVQEVNPYFLTVTEYVILTESALKKMEEVFAHV